MMTTAHQDTFARDNLPPREQWPDFINLDQLNYPERINCASVLLDRAVAEGHGERVVLRSPAVQWTYRELQVQANRIANVLRNELGLRSGERVLIRSANNPMLVACWFAIVKAGGIVVATMPLLRARELSTIIDKAQIRLSLCDERLVSELQTASQKTPVLQRSVLFNGLAGGSELEALMAAQSTEFSNVDTAADDVCLIAFTSGTTGKPKGTMHFQRDILATCDTVAKQVLQPTSDAVFIGSPPLAFTFGLGGLVLFPMSARASTVLLEAAPPEVLAQAINEYQASMVFTTPIAYRVMLGLGQSWPSLRQCVSAGETLPLPVWQAWFEQTGLRIIDGLGATEMLHIFITATDEHIRPGATGKPIPLYEARIVDEHGQTLPPDTIGRLAVRGPTGCRYLADERQQDYVQKGWNLTGDVYRMDQEGYFWFQARADDMIISAGYNIAGPEVEQALLAHQAVAECAVIGASDAERGTIVKAFVVLKSGEQASLAMIKTLQDFVKQEIAPYKYPRAIEFIEHLPRTETGKVQRFMLRQQELDQLPGVGDYT